MMTLLRTVFADRALLAMALIIIGLATLYVAYVALSLESTGLQVATHYSAFGDTHFYRNKWYYLISFAVFGAVVAIAHIAIMMKLATLEMRPLGIAFGWFSVLTLGIAAIITHSVLGIAFLS